jgi:hypothetical protein
MRAVGVKLTRVRYSRLDTERTDRDTSWARNNFPDSVYKHTFGSERSSSASCNWRTRDPRWLSIAVHQHILRYLADAQSIQPCVRSPGNHWKKVRLWRVIAMLLAAPAQHSVLSMTPLTARPTETVTLFF